MRTRLRTIVLGFVIVLSVVALQAGAVFAPAQVDERPSRHAGIAGTGSGGPPLTVRYAYELPVKEVLGLADIVASQGSIKIRLSDDEYVTLDVREIELFAPGQKKIRYLDENYVLIREEPILARSFIGWTADSREPAEVTIAPEGLYGAIMRDGVEYSLQPRAWVGDIIVQEVVHDFVSLPALEVPQATLPPLEESEPPMHALVYQELYIEPVAPTAFRNYAPTDWQNRIQNAHAYAENMWRGENGFSQVLNAIAAPNDDYSEDLSCSEGSATDVGLTDFGNFVWASGEENTNVPALYHGGTGQSDVWGCANGNCAGNPSGCLQVMGDTTPPSDASFAVQAKDNYGGDNYDATRSDHLGKAVAHELTHTAGEPTHQTDGSCIFGNTYNLMKTGITMGCRGTWRTSTTISRVATYTDPFIS